MSGDRWWPPTDPPINDGEYLTWAARWRYGNRRAPEHKIMGYSEAEGWTNPDDAANEHASFEVLSWRPLPAPPDDQP